MYAEELTSENTWTENLISSLDKLTLPLRASKKEVNMSDGVYSEVSKVLL